MGAAQSVHEAESSRRAGRASSATNACSPLCAAVPLPSPGRCATGGARSHSLQNSSPKATPEAVSFKPEPSCDQLHICNSPFLIGLTFGCYLFTLGMF